MRVKIIKIVDEAKDIRSLRLEPESQFKYIAGQWAYVRLDETLKHHFTLSSSPTEDFLQFTTKFRAESEYKQALWKLKTGDELEINGPFGSFVLDVNDQAPRLFLAGGIGITPFRSQIKYATDKKLDLSITLLYSVKSASDAAFSDLPFTQIIETVSQGRPDETKIKVYCPDFLERTWWICGPPAFVEAIVDLGQKMSLSMEKIRSEEFTGY